MKRFSVILFVVATLMFAVPLWRGGLAALWPQNVYPKAVSVGSFGHSQRLVLVAEGVGTEGGRVSVALNGKAVASFATGSVTLLVQDQDLVQIDSDLPQSIRVTVETAGADIVVPKMGDFIQVQHTVESLGRVIIRKRNG